MKYITINIVYSHQILRETVIGLSDVLNFLGLPHAVCFCETREIHDDNPENIYIIVGGHRIKTTPLKYIIYQTEQPGSKWFNDNYFEVLRRSICVWDFSPRLVDLWIQKDISAKFVPIRIPLNIFYDDCLHRTHFSGGEKDIDVLFYGGFNERRVKMKNTLDKLGIKVVFRFHDLFENDRENLISRSKIVLNIHFYEKASLEVHRILYLMARNVCVVSEFSLDTKLDQEYSENIVFGSFQNIPKLVMKILSDTNRRNSLAIQARKFSLVNQLNVSNVRDGLKCLL